MPADGVLPHLLAVSSHSVKDTFEITWDKSSSPCQPSGALRIF